MNVVSASILPNTLPGGGKWSGRIRRGKTITITALEDGANVSVLLFNADDYSERYNMPDTLKAQYTSHLTKGHVLMSDNGRVLASIVEDSLGWHDPLSGYATKEFVSTQYGATSYQKERNNWYRNGEDNFTVELFRNGLSQRDLGPVVNLFSKVSCGEDGNLHFVPNHAQKGDSVTLRTEMDVLMIVSNTPNPLDPRTDYPSVPINLSITESDPLVKEDRCLNHRPENRRAFENTWDYLLLTKGGIL